MIKKRIVHQEKYEWYDKCKKCGKKITGSSESMVIGNMKIHKDSKGCLK